MSDNINIPPEAVEAAENAYCEAWDRAEPALLAAIRAALAAWPGMGSHKVLSVRDNGEGYDLKQIGIILPLNTENPDD